MNEQVISDVLEKKELSGIDKKLVTKIIESLLDSKTKVIIEEGRFKTECYKSFVKKVRAVLRRQYGVFQNTKMDRNELLTKNDFTGLLKSHKSSFERLPYYEEVYNKIFTITGMPSSILDIGCGMNPVSFEFMHLLNVEYVACDINGKDLTIIQDYFNKKGITGRTVLFDAESSDYEFGKIFDTTFLFKLVEILETTKSHRLTEDIVKKVPAKWVIVSFSTKTLSGRNMTGKRRTWFEVMLNRLNMPFEYFEIPNELFYIVRKSNV
ncbi:Ribosomal RNA methyltransferase (FmrO) [Candidatus Tiddalikarchaeum anstoanum]|nr:Ribosomal RNA methyltransferase (FmrO) [Candidatus Tiddalikarchaeum anstoanum]